MLTPVGKDQPRPWNMGLLVGQKKPLQPKHVWSIRVRLEISRTWRDLAPFNLAIDSKLRACDLVKLRLDEICSGAKVRDRATIIQKEDRSTSPIRDYGADKGLETVFVFPEHRDCVRVGVPTPASISAYRTATGTAPRRPEDRVKLSKIPATAERWRCPSSIYFRN
jgi:hypothetical protein